ncbi:hypothetical protein [uncultured Azohydromonas sp.]|jgi:hypothetical protein|uniref:hypothetical protein n=1 Tax=uncultured Azohydromonas sp. TaxID=487342 RepID=UPI00260461CC|nr:hypothetical protein [uncultured Azohydromonas sp.]
MGGDAVQTSARDGEAADDVGGECLAGLTPEQRLDAIEQRLRRGADRIAALENGLATNTQLTTEIRELLEFGRNGLRLLGHLGVVMRWAGGIAAAVSAMVGLWHAVRSGVPVDSGDVLSAVVQAYRDGSQK